MDALLCPGCRLPLVRTQTAKGILWICSKCEGRSVALAVLREAFTADSINPIWLHALRQEGRDGRACPACQRTMIDVALASSTPVNVEVCRLCQLVWFDKGETQALTVRPAIETPPRLSEKALEIIAMAKLESLARRAEGPDFESEAPDEWWKQIAGYFGLPVQFDPPAARQFPFVTVLLALAATAASLYAFTDLNQVVQRFGLIPAEAMRMHGLTFLTSFFLHAGFIHLLGNMYFLLVFGNEVEEALGWWRYLALIAGAAFAGDLAHIALDPDSTLPCVGASGGIAGVIVFFALAFPRERLAFALRYLIFVRWIRLPAWSVLVLWIIFQLIGTLEQKLGLSSVSSIAHLGGASVGVVAWFAWRRQQRAVAN